MTRATLINLFQVPAGREEEFLRLWEEADELLRASSGYAATRLHRAVQPEAKYQFVNVAVLSSVEDWRAVITRPDFTALAARMAEFQPAPGLYSVVREHEVESSGG